MTLQSKRELIQAIGRVYRKASKKQKSQHLDHLELVTELKRNYLNRLLLAGYKERRKRPGRQSRYARDPEFALCSWASARKEVDPIYGHFALCGGASAVMGE